MKTPITYYGGKQTLAKRLLALFPPHKLYCEPFFGGGAVFFAKPPSDTEVINDLNCEVINFYSVLKKKFSELQKEIKATPHSRELFRQARIVYENPAMFSDVKRAWAFWTLTNQGFAGMVDSWGFGRTNSKEKSLATKRDSFSNEYKQRLEKVQIECNDALKVIDRCDSKDSFFYVDPPYINSHQGHYSGYTESDYEKLLDKLSKIKGKFLLSSYPSAILKKYTSKHKWYTEKVEKSIAVTKHTDKKKVEMMVMNYKPSPSSQRDLKKISNELKRLKIK